MAQNRNGQQYVLKPGYFALETKSLEKDSKSVATVIRLDADGREHIDEICGYRDLDEVEDMIVPLNFPFVPPDPITEK